MDVRLHNCILKIILKSFFYLNKRTTMQYTLQIQ